MRACECVCVPACVRVRVLVRACVRVSPDHRMGLFVCAAGACRSSSGRPRRRALTRVMATRCIDYRYPCSGYPHPYSAYDHPYPDYSYPYSDYPYPESGCRRAICTLCCVRVRVCVVRVCDCACACQSWREVSSRPHLHQGLASSSALQVAKISNTARPLIADGVADGVAASQRSSRAQEIADRARAQCIPIPSHPIPSHPIPTSSRASCALARSCGAAVVTPPPSRCLFRLCCAAIASGSFLNLRSFKRVHAGAAAGRCGVPPRAVRSRSWSRRACRPTRVRPRGTAGYSVYSRGCYGVLGVLTKGASACRPARARPRCMLRVACCPSRGSARAACGNVACCISCADRCTVCAVRFSAASLSVASSPVARRTSHRRPLHRCRPHAACDVRHTATVAGEFRVCVYRDESDGSEPTAIVAGAARGALEPLAPLLGHLVGPLSGSIRTHSRSFVRTSNRITRTLNGIIHTLSKHHPYP